MKKVGIVMGSDSDLPILRKSMDTLKELGIPFECHIYLRPPHPRRGTGLCPERPGQRVRRADRRCRYGGASGRGHCRQHHPSRHWHSLQRCRVLDGIDALLATVQMPSGIPVATVAINGGAECRFAGCPDSGGCR